MALDNIFNNFFYNLGRVVAITEIMNDVKNLVIQVNDNAAEKLPYQLREALKKQNHNLLPKLINPADIVLNGELPSQVLKPEQGNPYWIGYYHEKAYLDKVFKGVFGNVGAEVTEHVPARVEVPVESNEINELKR